MGVDLLSVAKSGLFASKKSLETTGHNIANVNTEGYSRQKTSQTTNVPVGNGNLVHGTGVRVNNIKRVHDEHIEKRLRNNLSENTFYKQKQDKLSQVENIFNEINSDGLNKIINKFFNSFRDLANQPENETIRSIVRENAKLVTKDFRRIRSTLVDIGNQVGTELERDVQSINMLLQNMSLLNRKIADLEGVHGETGDLRDQRDLAVKNLAEYFEVQTYSDEKNQFIVNAKGVGSLVSGTQVQELITSQVSSADASNGRDGAVEVFLKHKPTIPISENFKRGSFKGLIEVRNQNVEELIQRIDTLAYHFSNTVNAVHNRGFANRSYPTDNDGNAVLDISKGPANNINFFQEPIQIDGAAAAIDISVEIIDDLSNIATALAPNSPGDNRVAIAISKLQHERVFEGGTKTIEEHFLESIGKIGLSASKANIDFEQSQGILAQTKTLRERISGVSLDEEAANMVKFQQAYDASAKVLKTTDEMFKTVLSIMP